jgi:GTPase SAR1 family protein
MQQGPLTISSKMDEQTTVTILLVGDPGCGKSTFLSSVCPNIFSSSRRLT